MLEEGGRYGREGRINWVNPIWIESGRAFSCRYRRDGSCRRAGSRGLDSDRNDVVRTKGIHARQTAKTAHPRSSSDSKESLDRSQPLYDRKHLLRVLFSHLDASRTL